MQQNEFPATTAKFKNASTIFETQISCHVPLTKLIHKELKLHWNHKFVCRSQSLELVVVGQTEQETAADYDILYRFPLFNFMFHYQVNFHFHSSWLILAKVYLCPMFVHFIDSG